MYALLGVYASAEQRSPLYLLEPKAQGKDQILDGHHDAFDTWWLMILVKVLPPILICICLTF